MSQSPCRNHRVLIVDDTPAIHEDFTRALLEPAADAGDDELRQLLLGEARPQPAVECITLDVEHAFAGREALAKVEQALAERRPFAVAFVDMRMPPGWSGLETIERLWQADPSLQVVVCTAYSDDSLAEIATEVAHPDRLLILKKPFDGIEARQMARALSTKWNLEREGDQTRRALEGIRSQLEAEVEARKASEQRLMHGALHDPLTDLPNRALLSDRIERALALAKRDPEHRFAVMFLDLDGFKVINDSLGHEVGDRILIELSSRIQTCIRRSDCASRILGNTAARMGGDEFVVLLEGYREIEDVPFVAQRLLEQISQPITVGNHELRPTISIGIVHASPAYESAGDLLRDADTALYRAKQVGKDCYCVFDDGMRAQAMARLRVEADLRLGIGRNELFLQYQPIVALASQEIVGFEALVRWRHPQYGIIPPMDFVPIAEESGLILALGEWVLKEACAQVAAWRARHSSAGKFFVNVNFSSKQLMAANFLETVKAVLQEHGLDREDINLELTESILMQTFGQSALVLQQIESERFKLYVDDFGVGFSSLAYLGKLPVHALKLDRYFIKDLVESPSSQATVRAVIQMAHARGMKTIAEGVECPEQLALLESMGCELGQGFYFSRPVDAYIAESMMLRERARREAS